MSHCYLDNWAVGFTDMLRLGVVASSNYVPWPIVMFTYTGHWCQRYDIIDELIVACELKKRNLCFEFCLWNQPFNFMAV